MNNRDLLAVRAFVTAHDDLGAASTAPDPDVVLVDVTHSNLRQRHIEIRLHKRCTVDQLRVKIHQQTGTPPEFQHLQFYNNNNKNDARYEIPPPGSDHSSNQESYEHYPIGYFVSEQRGWVVHCTDTNPHSLSARGGLEDVSLVPKYRLSEADYDRKPDRTLRAWKREQQARDPAFTLRRHAADHAAWQAAAARHRRGLPLPDGFGVDDATGKVVRLSKEQSPTTDEAATESSFGPETVEHCNVGDRCQIAAGRRRGAVAWKGEIAGLGSGGFWVGIRLDEPTGRHDGTVASTGERYFDAPPRRGTFVRGQHVECGDFPERDMFDEDSCSDDDDDDDEL